jgi:hypothetical protein
LVVSVSALPTTPKAPSSLNVASVQSAIDALDDAAEAGNCSSEESACGLADEIPDGHVDFTARLNESDSADDLDTPAPYKTVPDPPSSLEEILDDQQREQQHVFQGRVSFFLTCVYMCVYTLSVLCRARTVEGPHCRGAALYIYIIHYAHIYMILYIYSCMLYMHYTHMYYVLIHICVCAHIHIYIYMCIHMYVCKHV